MDRLKWTTLTFREGGVILVLLAPVDPSFRALAGRLKFTIRRHKFNKDALSCSLPGNAVPRRVRVWGLGVGFKGFWGLGRRDSGNLRICGTLPSNVTTATVWVVNPDTVLMNPYTVPNPNTVLMGQILERIITMMWHTNPGSLTGVPRSEETPTPLRSP